MYTIQIYAVDSTDLHSEICNVSYYIKNLFGIFDNIDLPILKISYSNPIALDFIIKNICKKVNEHLYDIPEHNITNEDLDAANNFLKTKIIWNYDFIGENKKKNGSYIRFLFKLLVENKFLEVDYYLGYLLYTHTSTISEKDLRTVYETLHDFSDKINIDKKLAPRINYLINPLQEDINFLENFCPLTQIYRALITKSDNAIDYLLSNHNFGKSHKFMACSNLKKIITITVFTKYLYYDINCIKWINCPIAFEKYINRIENKKVAVECMLITLTRKKFNFEVIYVKCKLLDLITHDMIVENNWNLKEIILSTSSNFLISYFRTRSIFKLIENNQIRNIFIKLHIFSKQATKLKKISKKLEYFIKDNLSDYELCDEFFMEFSDCLLDISNNEQKYKKRIQFGSLIFGMKFLVGNDISFTYCIIQEIKENKFPIQIEDLEKYTVIGVYRNILVLDNHRFLKIFDEKCISIFVQCEAYYLAYFTNGTDEKIIYSSAKNSPKLFPARNMFSYIIGKKSGLYYFLELLHFR